MNGNERIGRMEVTPPRAEPYGDEVEVAVVGAGPAGLTTATMLSAYGIRTVVLDRAAGPARHSRAAVVHARTLETLELIGIVDELVRRGVVVPHFGIRDRDRRLLAVPFDKLPTEHPYTLMLPQDETEHFLREALHHRGEKILWRHEVTGVRQDTTGVDLSVRSPQGDKQVRARFVVGCDGAHSLVREAVGIPFEGATYPQSFVLADVRMDWGLPDDEVQLFFSPAGLVVVAPLPGGLHRVVATVDEAPAEPSLNDVQALLDARGPRASRARVEEVVWSSRFRVAHKVAARFREEAVFLCGDAAHVHSPAGGQGMNTGIQDAANLAWKLALVLRGHADEAAAGRLLGSYEPERKQVASGVVSTTHRLTRLATMRSPLARRLRNVLLAVAGRAGRLPRRLATNLAELEIVYRDGWSVDDATTVERWSPERWIATASTPSLAFTLAVPQGRESKVRANAARLPVRIVPVPGIERASLVRPDGYVAGRGAAGDGERLLGLLTQVLGADPRSGAETVREAAEAPRSSPSEHAAGPEVEGTR